MAGKVPTTYLAVPGRIKEYFEKIQRGTAPSRFTTEHLENLEFKSKNDRQLIPLLKALRFVDESNVPTQAYRDFLDPRRGKIVLGQQILSAYEGLFEVEKNAHKVGASELEGKFKTLANASEAVAQKMALTFSNLCVIADIDGARSKTSEGPSEHEETPLGPELSEVLPPRIPGGLGLCYHIELHLPNTTDVEVFRAIFKAIKEYLVP